MLSNPLYIYNLYLCPKDVCLFFYVLDCFLSLKCALKSKQTSKRVDISSGLKINYLLFKYLIEIQTEIKLCFSFYFQEEQNRRRKRD